jgi:hypothetical protein
LTATIRVKPAYGAFRRTDDALAASARLSHRAERAAEVPAERRGRGIRAVRQVPDAHADAFVEPDLVAGCRGEQAVQARPIVGAGHVPLDPDLTRVRWQILAGLQSGA